MVWLQLEGWSHTVYHTVNHWSMCLRMQPAILLYLLLLYPTAAPSRGRLCWHSRWEGGLRPAEGWTASPYLVTDNLRMKRKDLLRAYAGDMHRQLRAGSPLPFKQAAIFSQPTVWISVSLWSPPQQKPFWWVMQIGAHTPAKNNLLHTAYTCC